MAQQGFPPGRHSRGPHPDDAPYGDETQYREPPYADAGAHRQAPHEDASYGETPSGDAGPRRDDTQPPGHSSRRGSRGLPDGGGRTARGPHPDHSRRADRQRPGREAWQQADPFAAGSDTDPDLPPWAGPAVYPGRPTGTLRRPAATRRRGDTDYREPDVDAGPAEAQPGPGAEEQTKPSRRRGRAAAARLRKSRRRVYRWCAIAIAVVVVLAGVLAIVTHHSPKPAPYVTSLEHGEFKSVPSACSSVGTAVLDQYLPGSGRTTTNTLASVTNSQCSFTVDSKPNFLVMQVQAEAFQPFAAAAADGSATGNAQDNFVLAQLGLTHPPKKSALPPAQINKIRGLGQQAFMAFQNEHVTGIVTDIVTVVIRERNVVVTASLSGQESGHGFGPVPVATLEAGAKAAAQAVLTKVMTQPTA